MIGHELTHGVTQDEAGLIYMQQKYQRRLKSGEVQPPEPAG